jgi:hypothetical protein
LLPALTMRWVGILLRSMSNFPAMGESLYMYPCIKT